MNLSDEQLSKWIINKLEPVPPQDWDEDLYVSPLRCWICCNPQSNTEPGGYTWQPRDMVNDPAMTVMLLEKLLGSRDYECILAQDEIEMGWRPSAVKEGQSFMVSLIKNSLGRGIAEAFALAHGWTPESPR